MDWCFKCGVSGDKVKLFNVISEKGIVKACQNCLFRENLPVIKRASDFYPKKTVAPPIPKNLPIKMSKDSRTMYERLSRISGVQMSERKEENKEMEKQDRVLREMANRNFESKLIKEKGDTSDLIENFHWAIMRARRAKHMTQEQLAGAIGESEAAIRKAEQGILSSVGSTLIKKLENYFGIRLFKRDEFSEIGEQPRLRFDSRSSKSLTISDLRDVKKQKETRIPGEDFNFMESNESKENFEDKEQSEENEELFDEDIDDLFFGR